MTQYFQEYSNMLLDQMLSKFSGLHEVNSISEDTSMTNSEAMRYSAEASSLSSHAVQFSMSRAFYQQVMSDFLQQSARYLRESSTRRGLDSLVADNRLS